MAQPFRANAAITPEELPAFGGTGQTTAAFEFGGLFLRNPQVTVLTLRGQDIEAPSTLFGLNAELPMAAKSSASPKRRPRADARRNRERLLIAANEVFAEHGTNASLEEVARRAKVAIGTLYSHFATREVLLTELLRDRIAAATRETCELAEHPSASDALNLWVQGALAHTRTYRGVANSMLTAATDEGSELRTACQELFASTAKLLARAQHAKLVRKEATVSDLYALVGAVAWLSETMPEKQAMRLLGFVMDGLKPERSRTRKILKNC
jgi:AcrR family transcriptional regulator